MDWTHPFFNHHSTPGGRRIIPHTGSRRPFSKLVNIWCVDLEICSQTDRHKNTKKYLLQYISSFFLAITGSSESIRLSYVSATAKHTVIHIIETITNNYKQTVFLTAGTVNTWLDYCNSLSVSSSMDGPRSARMISGQLSLLSSVGQDTSQTAVMLWGWGVGAGWFVALADKRVGGRRNRSVIRR